METIRLSRLTENDLPDYFKNQWEYLCRDLFSDADTQEERAYFCSPEYRSEVRVRLLDGSLLLLRYEEKGAVLGFSQILLERGKARVMEFWVLPQYRGRGFGKVCWQKTEEGLKTLGIHRVTLEAATNCAEKFWKTMGFTALKQEKMEKSL